MTSIALTVTGAEVQAEVDGILTGGMVGIPVTITYDESWDGLRKTLVCKSFLQTRTIPDVENVAQVAPEVMIPGQTLLLGIQGRNDEGTIVIPTLWAYCGKIQEGADPAGDPTTEPTLPVWEQIRSRIGDMGQLDTEEKTNLVAAVNEVVRMIAAGITPEIAAAALADYLEENPLTEVDPTVPAWAKQPQKPTYTAAEVGALPESYTAPEAPVQSVNGKTGAVDLAASDVGALPESYSPPVTSVCGWTGNVDLRAQDVGALPTDGGTLTGPLVLTEGVHYGTELPEAGTPGRLFFKVVG